MLKHYANTQALREDYIRLGAKGREGNGLAWFANETEKDTLRYATIGDTRHVAKAEALIKTLDLAIETPRRVWDRSPAGAFCCVPDVLAGLPTPMRRQRETPDDRAAINILATTTSSGGIDAETLRKRGTVILALVMALSRIRPVVLSQLTVLDGSRDRTGETVITSEISTTPLDLASACYVLTSAGFARRLTYDLARGLNGFTGGWPAGFNYSSPKRYYTALVPRLGFAPDRTLIIGAARLDDLLLTDPIAWINAQINRFTQNQ